MSIEQAAVACAPSVAMFTNDFRIVRFASRADDGTTTTTEFVARPSFIIAVQHVKLHK
jgi:hypothetical protein